MPGSSNRPGLKVELSGLAARHPSAVRNAAPAIRPTSLTLEPGEHVAVIGPSGSGKTTLLHAVACALRPSAGRLALDGVDPWSLSVARLQKLRGELFLAPQVPPLPPRQRAVTTLLAARLPARSLWTSVRSLFYPVGIDDAYAALERFDLAEKLWVRVDRLSGGERQRVGLARALLAPARLWLIDEPLSALDPTRASIAIEALTSGARERGVTLVATLHQVDVATRFPRVVGLRDGEVAFDLPAGQVTRQHLERLYVQHEHELAGAPADPQLHEDAQPPSAAMHCR